GPPASHDRLSSGATVAGKDGWLDGERFAPCEATEVSEVRPAVRPSSPDGAPSQGHTRTQEGRGQSPQEPPQKGRVGAETRATKPPTRAQTTGRGCRRSRLCARLEDT